MKVLWVLAGPNGAGKTTFYETFLAKYAIPFVNADRIALDLVSANREQASYEAAALAAADRTRRLVAGASFATETVFSHPSKIELLRDARSRGYFVWVVYIAVASVDISLRRVERRVALGGHDVSPEKIASRTERSIQNLHPAVAIADRVDLYDNSDTTHAFRRVCRWEDGVLGWRSDEIPGWATHLVGGA